MVLTLRAIPPRLIGGSGREESDLAAHYFGQLWRHWSLADRATALALSASEALRCAGGNWRHGWDRQEQQLLAGSGGSGAHLGMKARKGLHRLLNPGAFPFEANPLKNKHLFAARATAAGLPIPVSFSGNEAALPGWLAREEAVIAKPNYSSKGAGIVGFRRIDGRWPEADIEARLLALWQQGSVVQRLYPPHAALQFLSPGALPSLRVMTCVNEAGAIEECGVVLRLSAGGPRPVDNFNAGNIVVAVDGEGRCGRAFRRTPAGLTALCQHPVTGEAIGGTLIPDVAAAITLSIRAHMAVREGFRVIGWDVGLTAGGPILIEGNWNPGTDILQLVSGTGLGDTRLGALYRHHLATLPADAWRAARPIEREPVRAAH